MTSSQNTTSNRHRYYYLLIKCLCLCGVFFFVNTCSAPPQRQETLFVPVAAVEFINHIPENDSINIIKHEYLYNGGGVGVGDFDKDGNPDLVFSGNLVSSALYLQRSSWEFEDVTAMAGLTTGVWCAGVNVSDVDGNGWEDIYFATLNLSGDNDTPNLLFLNEGTDSNGIPQFREAAREYGLDDTGYCTHSAWFDLENDGDLDLYVLNNAIETYNRNVAKGTDTTGRGRSIDRIYLQQKADNETTAPGAFTPSTIKTEGWGLGVAVQDFNQDGFADIYVANDFLSNDFLLINQQGEGFNDEIRDRTRHQSRNSMGVDVADLTGDGAPEIMVVDMLPDDNLRRKTMFGDIPHQGHRMELMRGYSPQFVRNTLQLNYGNGQFADVAFQAGVAATDWSWTPLLADFDNDGDRDIFVSNGYPKDITNKDFIDFNQQSNMFGTKARQLQKVTESLREVKGVHQPNYFFRNDGNLSFTTNGNNWLSDAPTYSNGAVFVDLDLDGDLDLVTNNINEKAGVFRNQARERNAATTHYLQVDLDGPPGNPDGLGTKIWLYSRNQQIYHEHYRQRGYLSTVSQLIHFGLGENQRADSLIARFPDGRTMVMTDLPADEIVHLSWSPSLPVRPLPSPTAGRMGSAKQTQRPDAPVHQESPYSDFDNYALAVRDNSHDGPVMLAMDLDGDGTDELIFGGAAGQAVSVWKQHDGKLELLQELDATLKMETTALAEVRIGPYQALYLGNGSSEFRKNQELLQDQVYVVENGRLVQQPDVSKTPELQTAVVAQITSTNGPNSFLFIGSRMKPGEYPISQPSLLLATQRGGLPVVEALDLGMVTDAVSGDFNGDGFGDLAVVGEFAPVRILLGTNKGLGPASELPGTSGWYYSLTQIDLDEDGDLDLVAGNAGLNTPYQATPDYPVVLMADDFDNNGSIDPILTAYNDGVAYPVVPRNTLARQLPGLKREFPDFAAYGKYPASALPPVGTDGITLSATEMRSLYLENDGNGNFAVRPLPALAQTAPIRDAIAERLPDGRKALFCVQNDLATEPLGGPLDAGAGVVITLNKRGELEVINDFLRVNKDARSIVKLKQTGQAPLILVGINGAPVLALSIPEDK